MILWLRNPNLVQRRLILRLVLGFFVLGFGSFAQDKTPDSAAENISDLRSRLSDYIAQPRFSAAAWGMKIISLDTGKTLFEHNAGKLMKPASNAKLYTGALALDRLGPNYRIRTSLFATAQPDTAGTLKGDLIVYGRGDPSFAARFNNGSYQKSLEPLVEAIAAAGIKQIEGSLIGDASYFRGPPFGSGWAWDDLQSYYGAEVAALTVEDNVLDLIVRPGPNIGYSCQITVNPATTFVKFINQTKTAAKGANRSIAIYRPIGDNTVYLSGSLPLDGSNHTDAVTVHAPAGLFVSLLKDALERRGITVSGKPREQNDSGRETHDLSKLVELGSVRSRPLSEILIKMLKPSQNLYAQLLLLQVGAMSKTEKDQSGKTGSSSGSPPAALSDSSPPALNIQWTSEEMGLVEMNKFLQQVGIKRGEVLLEEGSGLSRGCLLTPNATVELLKFMSHHKYADVYRESLPIAGVDGTLRNRMKETKAARNLRAKTGRLRYVDTLSGYATTAGGESVAFSIMLNNYSNPAALGRDDVDKLAIMLVDFHGKTSKQDR